MIYYPRDFSEKQVSNLGGAAQADARADVEVGPRVGRGCIVEIAVTEGELGLGAIIPAGAAGGIRLVDADRLCPERPVDPPFIEGAGYLTGQQVASDMKQFMARAFLDPGLRRDDASVVDSELTPDSDQVAQWRSALAQ